MINERESTRYREYFILSLFFAMMYSILTAFAVVLKDGCCDQGVEDGLEVEFRYRYSPRGFSATMTDHQIEVLRNNSCVKFIEEATNAECR